MMRPLGQLARARTMAVPSPSPAPIAADRAPLARIAAGLRALYGDRLVDAILYGSRARGEARPESDYDVLVVLGHHDGAGAEARRLGALATRLLDEERVVVNFHAVPVSGLAARTAFMAEIRRDGLRL
jgi:uncharacterized protein